MPDQHSAAVVVGVGPIRGLGASLAKRFAQEGLTVFIAGRTQSKLSAVADHINASGGAAIPVTMDATHEAQVRTLFETVETHGLIPELVTCTVDYNQQAPLLETDCSMFKHLWQANCLAAFLVGKEAAERMVKEKRGTIIFTGASASLRARPSFTAFACAKFALRALAQGMAKELGPQGIHVAHVIIDGVINGERAREQFPEFVRNKDNDAMLSLEAIAEAYWYLHTQSPTAWTQELDLRPYKEAF